MPALERSALVVLATLKLGLRVEVISNQAAAMGFQPGRWNVPASLTVKSVILGLVRLFEIWRRRPWLSSALKFM
jgi:hypothetical protein